MQNKKINQGFTLPNTAKSNLTGFTLVELLVVISIIGFLVVASVFSFNIVRMQSRDAIRASNANTISRALALYMNDFGVYPASSGECLSPSNAGISLLSAGVIHDIPLDPLWPTTVPTSLNNGYAVAPSTNFCYYYYVTANNYYLSFYLESNSKSGNTGIHVMTPAGSLN